MFSLCADDLLLYSYVIAPKEVSARATRLVEDNAFSVVNFIACAILLVSSRSQRRASTMYSDFVPRQRSDSEKLFDPTSATRFFAPAPMAFTAALANAAL
jgi:hypothetical protein